MEKPTLLPIEPTLASPETLILIPGSLSEQIPPVEGKNQWSEMIRQLGWKGAIYQLRWDQSQFNLSLASVAHQGVEGIIAWHKYKNVLRRFGKYHFPKLIAALEVPHVSLFSWSLGTRIAYYTVREWSLTQTNLQDVVLLAGTVRRDRNRHWSALADHLTGNLINIYNSEDLLLTRFCQILEWERSACGVKPIKEEHPKLINIDATTLMRTAEYSALNYLPVLQNIVKQGNWVINH